MSVIPTRDQVPQIVRGGPVATRRAERRPAARGETGMTGGDVLRIIRKRKWLILFSLVICVGLSVLAHVLWQQYLPLYDAMVVMKINPPRPTIITPSHPVVQTPYLDSLAAQYVSLVQGEGVLQDAIGNKRIQDTTWFQGDRDTALERLQEDLRVGAPPGTGMVTIRMRMVGSNESKELPEILNAVAEQAIERAQEGASQGTQKSITRLTEMQSTLSERRDRIRAEMAKLIRDAEVPDMDDPSNELAVEHNAIRAQRRAMEIELAQADGALELIRKQIETGEIRALPQVIQALDLDPSLRALKTTLLNLRAERENLLRKFGPRHRTVQNFEARVKSMDEEVQEREAKLIEDQVNSMLTTAQAQKSVVLDRLTKLREQYAFVDASVRGLRATINAYEQLKQQNEEISENFKRIEARLIDLRGLRDDPPLSILKLAATPREPTLPQLKINLPLGILLGLIVGLGLAMVLELVDTSIKGPSDVSQRVDLPLLGMVPHQDDLEENIEDFRLAFATHPNSLISEAFRQIRTCLQFSGPAGQRKSLLVTSALPEDGRTTVTLNLAASAARNGRKVLVIDANFRQPMIRKLYSACPDGGLSSALVGQANWREMVMEVEPNLYVIGSGPLPPNPAELLGSEQMKAIIGEMNSEYDQILFDTPPCLLVTDAAALSSLVDSVILVVRAGANTHGIVQRTREVLNRIGAHVMGIVLNGVRAMAGGYLRKNYEAFYDYHDQARLPEK